MTPDLSSEILSHYNAGREKGRLSFASGKLEFVRTQEIVRRFTKAPPATVLDVGGAAGIHAFPLAEAGYEVHLIDPVPFLLDQAREASEKTHSPLSSIEIGDARDLNRESDSVDAVLLCGPLYHLTEKADRIQALSEARRVLRPGGVVVAAVISRFASALDGIFRGFLTDPNFASIVEQDLTNGQHRNPDDHPHYFTTAYFHHPLEIGEEIKAAGFNHETTLSIEGPGWLLNDFDTSWEDEKFREAMLDKIRKMEAEPTMLGSSAHIMGVGRKNS